MKRGRKPTATQLINEVKRRTQRSFSSEEKIKIALEGLRGDKSIAEICRRASLDKFNRTDYLRHIVDQVNVDLVANRFRINVQFIRG